jgi:hypothetical protein
VSVSISEFSRKACAYLMRRFLLFTLRAPKQQVGNAQIEISGELTSFRLEGDE